MKNKSSRRNFIKKSTVGAIGLSVPFSAKSYSQIIGANSKLGMGHIGLNSRMGAHLHACRSFKDGLNFVALCDVDNRTFDKTTKQFDDILSPSIKKYEDVRELLENKDIDVVTIATPDHWHAPMGIMAMNAGKHVYLEKPCSHNPQEGEWLVQTQKKTGKVIQVGNQQRSAPTSISLVRQIHDGIIGNAYYAKAFYENNRKSIGEGKTTTPPAWLNWDLFQGPAPREDYRDNIVHYNWHWFWNWGTGEISNNGLHEMDIARWALGVDFPETANSAGGRFAFEDDWEFYDTQLATFNFKEGKAINWEGRSCNSNSAYKIHGRGTQIFGTKGSAIVDRSGYRIYDEKDNLIKEESEKDQVQGTNTLGISGLDAYHFDNFFKAIRNGEALHSNIEEAHKSTMLCHLGNMAQKTQRTLKVDPSNGKPYDYDAMQMWGRKYESGWKPKV